MAHIQAALGLVGPESLDLVQHAEHRRSLGHLIDLAPDAAVGSWNGSGVNTEIEQRAGDRPASGVGQLVVDPAPPGPIERSHQRSVEENKTRHGVRTVTPAPTAAFTKDAR